MGKEGGRSSKRGRYEAAETPSGCVSAFFHLFDFHPFHFSLQQHHQPPQPSSICHNSTTTSIPKEGTEAPRNSLESEDNGTTIMVGSISKEDLKIPKKNKLFIKTSTGIISSSNMNDLSPGTKTPTLVARLMGLDLLPDTQSPSSSSPSPSSSSSSCLSATKSHIHHHHYQLRPRQQNNNVVITEARHSMDDRVAASRFLPETPRRRSDVERHRLSLQINKENMGGEDDLLMELPRFSFSKLKFEEHNQNGIISNNKSPRHYAKQIVKQMKESVMSSSKVGFIDVTNTVKNNRSEKKQERGGGEFVVVGKFMRSKKKSPRTRPTCSSDELSSPGKVSDNPSCPPRLRFMDPKKNSKLGTVATTTPKDQISPLQLFKFDNVSKPHQEAITLDEQEAHQFHQKQKSSSVPKCKKVANEKFSPHLKKKPSIRNKQDESFVRPLSSNEIKIASKSKRSSNHPLLINLLNMNNTVQNINSNITTTTLPSAAVNTKILPQKKQVCVARGREAKYCSSQLSSGSSQTYNNKREATSSSSSSSCILLSTSTTTGESNVDELDNKRKTSGSMFNNNGPEFEYVSSILSRTGLSIKKGTTTTTTVSGSLFRHQWQSPSTQQQLLDPSIFHHIEQQFQNQNQKQVFSVSSKYGDMGLRCNRRLLFDLVNETLMLEEVGVVGRYYYDVEEAVWERIGRFQSNKKCEVLEDIDALVEMEDMGKKMKMRSAEAMVAEIEGNIMDTLLHETVRIVTECCYWWWYGKDEDDVDGDDAV